MADYLKIPELARRLDISEKTARRYVKAGLLSSTFIGGAYRVTEEGLEEFLAAREVRPKAEAPPEPKAEERRAQEDLGDLGDLWGWKGYLTRRVEWCERVLQKPPEESFNNPFLSLDTAIQWAVHVGAESAQLQDAVRTQVRSYTDADSEIVGELHALLDRFVAVDSETDVRVRAMMDEAGLTDEDKQQRLRLIRGSAA